MPSLLRPDQFELHLRDGAPVVVLHDVSVSERGGWSFLNRMTLLVIDGPGDEGFLLPRAVAGADLAPEGWDDAVAARPSVDVVAAGSRFAASVIA